MLKMPLFGGSPFDADVERATSDTKTEEDWSLIIEICDKINQSPSGAKDAMKSLMKRLKYSSPRVVMHSLSLLGACVDNCGKTFQLEMCTREFYDFAFHSLKKPDAVQATLATRLKELIQDWVVAFEGDSRLGLMKKLYVDLKAEGVIFNEHNADKAVGARTTSVPSSSSASRSAAPAAGGSYQDDIDLARAIELSLQEANATASATPTSSLGGDSMYPSLYPSTSSSSAPARASSSPASKRKVRALYDFDAAEDNELSFKAGELINIVDATDENWWRGETLQGAGLFPATFVTEDLSATPEPVHGGAGKSVRFSDEVSTQPKVQISEEKIMLLLEMLHTAAEDNEQEETTIKELEGECEAMKPLIKHKIDIIDRERSDLMRLNEKFQNALRMYQQLMKEVHVQPQQPPPTYSYPDGAGQATMYEPTSTYQPSGYAPVDVAAYQVPGPLPTNAPPSGYGAAPQPAMHAAPQQQGMLPPSHGVPPMQGMPPGSQPISAPASNSQPVPYYSAHDPAPAIHSDAVYSGSPSRGGYSSSNQQPPMQYFAPTAAQDQPPSVPGGAITNAMPPPMSDMPPSQGYDMPPPGSQPAYYYGQPGAGPHQQPPPGPMHHQPAPMHPPQAPMQARPSWSAVAWATPRYAAPDNGGFFDLIAIDDSYKVTNLGVSFSLLSTTHMHSPGS